MKTTLNPYIHFNDGKAEAAVNFYKAIFGAKVTINRFGDFDTMPVGEEFKNQIMHADLEADGLRLMISDTGREGGVKEGDNVAISISGDNEEQLTAYFAELSDGGKVTVPLQMHPWGATFGTLTDKFGINWLINISKKDI